MGAHNLAVSEITMTSGNKNGKAYLNAVLEEFSADCLVNEGSKEDIAMDVKEGELPPKK